MKKEHIIKKIKIAVLSLLIVSNSLLAQNWDINLLKNINPKNPNSGYWKTTSGSIYWASGATAIGTLAYGFIADDQNAQHNGYEVLISSAVGFAFTESMKAVIKRERPQDKYPNEVFVNSKTTGYAFPSGHASSAFALATTLTVQYHKRYISVPAYLWAGSVGYSRIYLGKHYPTDVLAGAIVGAGSSYLSHILSNKLFNRKKQIIISENKIILY